MKMEWDRAHRNYKYCVVPQCASTTLRTPDKIFITLPQDPKRNLLWQKAMRREKMLSLKSTYHVCEDHFNLEVDMENYLYFKLMENVRIKMKPNVVPHIFDCQKNRTMTSLLKKQRQDIIEELEQPSTSKKIRNPVESVEKEVYLRTNLEYRTHCMKYFKSTEVQVNLKPKMVSRGTQCNQKCLRTAVSSKKIDCSLSSSSSTTKTTSPFGSANLESIV
ncbi:uncharacterized protein LOC108906964 [Anoplophora glabripennis]|uniref:uncharacterized protein LOC108906964 n=1 Tax=Anoplophora glabripennis TaxID=217634 RepID=UPI000875402B|nr:uncharacterized protein LOC108906964 [Anoplophora glabripennis]